MSVGIFIGFMFLGLGLGMLYGNTGAGLLIGMGIGFIVSSLLSKGKRIFIEAGVTHRSILITSLILGGILIFFGLWVLGIITISWNVIAGFLLLLLGIAFIVWGALSYIKH